MARHAFDAPDPPTKPRYNPRLPASLTPRRATHSPHDHMA